MSELSYQDVIAILELIDTCPYGKVKLKVGDMKLKVVRTPTGMPGAALQHPASADPADMSSAVASQAVSDKGRERTPISGRAAPAAVGSAAAPRKADVAVSPQAVAVRAPMEGTFYAAPEPGAAPFTAVGAAVDADTQVGIVEVMKLFTAISSPIRGTIEAILVQNEAVVQEGDVIMWIAPTDQPGQTARKAERKAG